MWLGWLFNGEVFPPSGFNQLDLPDSKFSLWNELTMGWLWPLMRIYGESTLREELPLPPSASQRHSTRDALLSSDPLGCQKDGLLGGDPLQEKTAVHGDEACLKSGDPPQCPSEKTETADPALGDAIESIAHKEATERHPASGSAHGHPHSLAKRRPSLVERLAADNITVDDDGGDDLDRADSRGVDDGLHRIESRARQHSLLGGQPEATLSAFADPGPQGIPRTKEFDQSLFRALCSTYRWRLLIGFTVYLCGAGISIGSAFITKRLIAFVAVSHEYLTATEQARTVLAKPPGVALGVGLAIALSAMILASIILQTASVKVGMDIGWMARSGLSELICRKSLTLSAKARFTLTDGRLTNGLAADTNTMIQGLLALVGVFGSPIIILGGFGALITILGPVALVGLGCVLALLPFSWWALQSMQTSNQGRLVWSDKRINLTSEVLGNIRGIKLYGYEGFFQERVFAFRQRELRKFRDNVWQKAALKTFMNFSPVLATVVTFIAYAYTGHDLQPATIFSAMQIFGIISGPISDLSFASIDLLKTLVASRRIRDILVGEDLESTVLYSPGSHFALDIRGRFIYDVERPAVDAAKPRSGRKSKLLKVFRGSETSQTKELLHPPAGQLLKAGIPFQICVQRLMIERGAFVCIVGKIGSGKTSLLHAMLGELRMIKGRVIHGSQVAYVSQRPWIQSGAIRAQIAFGNAEEPERMRYAVKSCALDADLEFLSDGLDTEIGERGITLSGGQKARLALARAVYADREMILLDDPLSAVDAHVSQQLIHECILGAMGNTTRLLVTHNLEVLPFATDVLVVEDGAIAQRGSFAELRERPGWLRNTIEQHGKRLGKRTEDDHDQSGGETDDDGKITGKEQSQATTASKLTESEERIIGSVTWAQYGRYARMMGGPATWIALAIGTLLQEGGTVGTSVVLGLWSGSQIDGFAEGHYVALYGSLSTVQIGAVVVFVILWGHAGLTASRSLFAKAYTCVMSSPISWFDRTPSGRITSRLSKDVLEADINLPVALSAVIMRLAQLGGTFGLIMWTYRLLGILVVPLVLLFVAIAEFYRRTAREIKRLDSTIRSFTYSAFSEQLAGLETIRAFEKQEQLILQMSAAIDRQQSAQYLGLVLRRWLGLRLNSVGCILILGVGLFGVGFREKGSPSKFGVVLTYTIVAVSSLAMLIRVWTNLEQSMNSVERLNHYGDLSPEHSSQGTIPPSNWPTAGHLTFQDVKLRYRADLPLVLKGLSFEVQPGEKVGIVGRTGAGKSTIAQALFRIVKTCAGQILVDNVDIQTGTMRDNLDPTRLFSDAELNEALGRCGLQSLSDAPKGDLRRFEKFKLDAEVALDGNNFSAGERQLGSFTLNRPSTAFTECLSSNIITVALARAVLKGSQVILLDEATSSVDADTDAQFQRTIRKELHGTVITMAHRLISIAFYDKILVLDEGRAAEFGTPLELFDQADSIFRGLCDAANLTRAQIVQIRFEM